MKRDYLLFTILILLGLSSCVSNQSEIETVDITPAPVKIDYRRGSTITLDSNIHVFYQKKILGARQAAGIFCEMVNAETGWNWKPEVMQRNVAESGGIFFDECNENTKLVKEGYRLHFGGKKIVLSANDFGGFFYGVQSFVQIISQTLSDIELPVNMITMPRLTITDYPRFSWRGMHLDVSRHFFDVDFVKQYIDLIALHKMNVFHWHLTDDNGWRIEIKKYPLLTDVAAWRVDREEEPWNKRKEPLPGEKSTYGGFYTQEQIKDIVAYASARNITVVPEIEMPGHTSEVFAAYPQYSCTGKKLAVRPGGYWPNQDVFCAGNEQTFQFVEDVLLEIMELFPSEYIHIGGDEADKTHWKSCPLCHKRMVDEQLSNENELQSYFIQRIEKFLIAHNRRLIGWDEILEGGLAPEATVMSWRGIEGGLAAAKQEHDVVMCPGSHCYFDHYQAYPPYEQEAIGGFTTLRKVYSFEPVPEELNAEEAKFILGGQGNLWTEYIATPCQAEYMVVPRMTALAEVLWSPKDKRDWIDFRTRLASMNRIFDAMGINYAPGSYAVDIHCDRDSVAQNFNVWFDTEHLNPQIYYTVDGSEPTNQSTLYEGPFTIDSTLVIKAIIYKDNVMMEVPSVKRIHMHKALGAHVEYRSLYSNKYPAAGLSALVDGMHGGERYSDGYWQAFQKVNMDVVIDLGKVDVIKQISADFVNHPGAWIFLPSRITVEVSEDGQRFKGGGSVVPDVDIRNPERQVKKLLIQLPALKARYLRVIAESYHQNPSWHEYAGEPCWLFCDEIVVE